MIGIAPNDKHKRIQIRHRLLPSYFLLLLYEPVGVWNHKNNNNNNYYFVSSSYYYIIIIGYKTINYLKNIITHYWLMDES